MDSAPYLRDEGENQGNLGGLGVLALIEELGGSNHRLTQMNANFGHISRMKSAESAKSADKSNLGALGV
jgi:hypothetical protein